jgi:ADP-ribose pyrophosphatase
MSRQVIYEGRKIRLALDRVVVPGGATVEREVVLHPGAVVMLPLVDAEHVCLVRNYRHSVAETLLELPAGTLQPPESPEDAAARELAEETGYRADRWRKLAEFYPSPGVLNERMYLFVAEGLTPGPTQLEDGEQLVPQVVAWQEAVGWALDGTIRDAKTLTGLLLWDRLRQSG